MDSSLKIGFIGAGAMARGLSLAMAAADYQVTAVASRTYMSANELSRTIPGCRAAKRLQEVVDECDLVFLTTPDDSIAPVAEGLAWSANQGAVHCSGSGSLDLLLAASRLGAECGSLHPFQTLTTVTTGQQALDRFQGVTFAVEASGKLLDILKGVVVALGGKEMEIDPRDRVLYHSSAVMSCGYLIAALNASGAIWEAIGFTREDGVRAAMSMVMSTLDGIPSAGLDKSLTGPLARGDVNTLRSQMEALENRLPQILPLFLELSRASFPVILDKVEDNRLREMRELISEFMGRS